MTVICWTRDLMKILFDQGTPAPLRHALSDHTVKTAHEMGWSTLNNGDLLQTAETSFDALLTTDQNLRYQQNRTGRRLAILILPTTSWPKIRNHIPQIVEAIRKLQPADFLELVFPE